MSGGRAEGDNDVQLDESELELKPDPASRDLRGVRPLVQPALATCAPLEMLHSVGEIDALSVDAGLRQRLIEDMTRRTDEGMSGDVFFVSGLFADEQHLCRARPFA